jgi:hypothetical protein
MEKSDTAETLENTIRSLVEQQMRLVEQGIEPHLVAGAFLALGIDRFNAVMGENHAAFILEQAAADLRSRRRLLH